MRHEKGKKQVSTSITVTKESNQNKTKSTDRRENSINGKSLASNTFLFT